MSADTTILLHTGTHKTGSTSLQKTLDEHRNALRDVGVTYLGTGGPYPNLYSAFLPDPMSFVWNRHSGLDEPALRARDAETLETLEQDLARARGTTVVISSEYLSMLDEDALARLRDFLARRTAQLNLVGQPATGQGRAPRAADAIRHGDTAALRYPAENRPRLRAR